MQSFTSIPFKAESGITQVNGIAKFSHAGIVIEFESKYFGLISKGVEESRISTVEIHDVKFRKGFLKFGAKIDIRLKSLQSLSGLPNSDGKVSLKIMRYDFDQAREAVAELQKAMTDHAASLPPAHTPVSVLFDESENETRELN